MAIHSTAIIDPSARLAADVDVGPYVVIGPKVEVGAGTTIGPHAVLIANLKLGAGCRVHAHAVLGDTPQDTAFHGAESSVEIGDGVTIREGVTIHRGTKDGTVTRVGDGCFLMGNSHLAHNVVLGRGVILANGVLLGGYVEVGDNAFISGNSAVHQFCHIGRLAMVAGEASISQDVPPFCMTATGAFNVIAGLNVVGLRRAGLSAEERLHVKRAFNFLYRSGLNPAQAVERITTELPVGPAHEIAHFIRRGKRGFCRLGREAASNND